MFATTRPSLSLAAADRHAAFRDGAAFRDDKAFRGADRRTTLAARSDADGFGRTARPAVAPLPPAPARSPEVEVEVEEYERWDGMA